MFMKHHRRHHHLVEPPPASKRELSLSQVPPGSTCQVLRVHGGHELVGRLACLGFTPGAEVVMLQNYGRGPLIARVRGARLALGRREAERILVWTPRA
jgi:ferrous iron transport protein A